MSNLKNECLREDGLKAFQMIVVNYRLLIAVGANRKILQ